MCRRLWHQCHNHWTYKSIFLCLSDIWWSNEEWKRTVNITILSFIPYITHYTTSQPYQLFYDTSPPPHGTYLWFLSVNRHWKPADHWINIFSTYMSNISFIVSYYNLSHFNFCCHYSEAKLGSFCFAFCGWTGDLFPQFLFFLMV